MTRFEIIQVENLQRLADFHKWGCAIAESLGYTSADFTEAYEGEVSNQVEEAINAEPVGIALLKYLEGAESFNGPATELLDQLKVAAVESKINITLKYWPQDGSHLSKKINELKPALSKKGYQVINKNGTPRKIIIAKTGQTSLMPPPTDPTLPQQVVTQKPVAKVSASSLLNKEEVDQTYNLICLLASHNEGNAPIDKIPNKIALNALLRDGKVFDSSITGYVRLS
jgi:hypothetical protein